MLTIKEIIETANKTTAENLEDKDMKMAEINYPMHAAATVITEELNGTGCYKSWILSSKTLPWIRRIQKCIKGVREERPTLSEIKRGKMKA